jgi:hypothetical protein
VKSQQKCDTDIQMANSHCGSPERRNIAAPLVEYAAALLGRARAYEYLAASLHVDLGLVLPSDVSPDASPAGNPKHHRDICKTVDSGPQPLVNDLHADADGLRPEAGKELPRNSGTPELVPRTHLIGWFFGPALCRCVRLSIVHLPAR